jgi:hypothetical protein
MSQSQQTAAPEPVFTDPLDRLLAASLASRPEALPISNLAERAIAHAGMLDRLAWEQRRTLVIHRWRLRFIYTAAAMLIFCLIWAGGSRLISEQRAMASTDDSISSTDSTTPSTSTYVLWIGGLLFICTLAGLATQGAIAPDGPSLVV